MNLSSDPHTLLREVLMFVIFNRVNFGTLASLIMSSPNLDIPDILKSQANTNTKLDALDSEISRLSNCLFLLRQCRNTLPPIAKLPVELLSRIFVEYALSSDSLFDMSWMHIMLVCRHWKDVAYSTQTLWSYLQIKPYGTNITKLTTQLKLSGASPLSVKLNLSDQVLTLLSCFEPRVPDSMCLRYLDVSAPAVTLITWFNEVQTSTYPLLEDLQVIAWSMRDIPAEQSLCLPKNFLNGGAPKLRSLKLRNVPMDWNLVHNLTDISVTNHIHDPVLAFSSSTFLSALGRSPLLHSLEVYISLLDWPNVSQNFVELQNLASLKLYGDVHQCTAVLSQMVFPPTASLAVQPQGILTGPDARKLLICYRKHFRASNAHVLRSFQLISSKTNFLIHGLTDTALHDYMFDSPYVSLNSHPFNEYSRRQIMTKFVHALPIDSVTHLDVRFLLTCTEKSWKIIFSLLPSLRTITARVEIISTLQLGNTLLKMMEGPSHAVVPLQCLHLDATYARVITGEEVQNPVEMGKQVFAVFVRLLRRLRKNGTPLNILQLTDIWCVSGKYTSKRLHRLVGSKLIINNSEYDPVAARAARKERNAILREMLRKKNEDEDEDEDEDEPLTSDLEDSDSATESSSGYSSA